MRDYTRELQMLRRLLYYNPRMPLPCRTRLLPNWTVLDIRSASLGVYYHLYCFSQKKKKKNDGVTLVSPSEQSPLGGSAKKKKKNLQGRSGVYSQTMMAMKSFWTAVLIEVSWGFAQDGGLVSLSQCRVKYTSIWRTMLNEATVWKYQLYLFCTLGRRYLCFLH